MSQGRERGRGSSRRRWLGGLWLVALASCLVEHRSARSPERRGNGHDDREPVVMLRNESVHPITDARVTACGSAGAGDNQLRQGTIWPGGRQRIVLGHAGCHDIVARVDDGSVQRFSSVEVRGETVVEVRAP